MFHFMWTVSPGSRDSTMAVWSLPSSSDNYLAEEVPSTVPVHVLENIINPTMHDKVRDMVVSRQHSVSSFLPILRCYVLLNMNLSLDLRFIASQPVSSFSVFLGHQCSPAGMYIRTYEYDHALCVNLFDYSYSSCMLSVFFRQG